MLGVKAGQSPLKRPHRGSRRPEKKLRRLSDIVTLASAVLVVLMFLALAALQHGASHRPGENEASAEVQVNTAYFGR
jgi:hypothetical protein